MQIDYVKKLIVGILQANKIRSYPLSGRAIQKIIYIKLVKNSQIRNFLGLTEDDILRVVTVAPFGPTEKIVFEALNELTEEKVLNKKSVEFYENRKLYSGTTYTLREGTSLADVNLPFDIRSLLVYGSIEKLVIKAKNDLLNRLTGREYQWKSPWNLRLAYSLFRQLYLNEQLAPRNSLVRIIDLLTKFDMLFEIPVLNNWKQYKEEPILPSTNEFFEKLVAVINQHSPSGKEETVARLIRDWVNDYASNQGIENKIQAKVDEDYNLVVVLKGRVKEKILFIFHLDTVEGLVPVRLQNGILSGRGAVDNKSQGVSAIYTLMLLAANGITPPFSIAVIGTCYEEEADKSKRGIVKAIKRYRLSRDNIVFAVIMEATDLNVAVGQRSRWSGKIKIFGPGGHVAHIYQDEIEWIKKAKNRSIDAFSRFPDLAALVDKALCEIRKIPSKLPENGEGALGKTTIRVDREFENLRSNQTPSIGYIKFEIRLGEEEYRELIKMKIRKILERWLISPFGFEKYDWNEECSGVSDFLSSSIGKEISGLLAKLKLFFNAFNAKMTVYEFGTDGRYIVEAGIPTFGLAPGQEYYAHRSFSHPSLDISNEVFERIKVADLFRAIIIYSTLIQICDCRTGYTGKAEAIIRMRKVVTKKTPYLV